MSATAPVIEVTRFKKTGADPGSCLLTKRLALSTDGSLVSDGSACVMVEGFARRARLNGLDGHAALINNLNPDEAIALGALRPDLADEVRIVTKRRLEGLNGGSAPDIIARSAEFFAYRPKQPAPVLIDVDVKGIPDKVLARIAEFGSYWDAIASAMPTLADAGRVIRASTSANLSRQDTGASVPGSNGQHIYLVLADGSDAKRFLQTLHGNCWAAGMGWMVVGAGGQLLDRSLVDRSVYAAERLVFEANPSLQYPLQQAQREAKIFAGGMVDSRAVCPDLTNAERTRVRELQAAERKRLKGPATQAKAAFVTKHASRVAQRTGCTLAEARHMVERQCGGVLLSGIELPFDAADLAGATVGDVLRDPDRFINATLADPLQGAEAGRGRAMVLRRPNGTVFVHSFAHGRTDYTLVSRAPVDKGDARAGRRAPRPNGKPNSCVKGHAKPQPKPKLAPNQPPLGPGRTQAQEGEHEAAVEQDHFIELPVIVLRPGELHLIADAAEAAIMELKVPIFQRGPALVRPAVWKVPATHGRIATAAGLSTLKAPAIVDVLSAVANFQRFDSRAKELVRANPPKQIADILLSRYGLWNLPTIAGVITTPTLRPNGSILSASGYDPATRLYHAADPTLKLDPVVYNPTRADAERALVLLLDLLVDFPFVIVKAEGKPDRHLSRSVALSALITPVVRGALPVAPMHSFRANAPGTGKSYLTDTISAIATGQPCPVMSVAPDDPKETEKRLIALLLAGFPIICLDNVNGELGGDTLAQAIERPLLHLRPLGSSDTIMIESKATIFANGNQLIVRDDMLRRTLPGDLDAEMERPETRSFSGDPVATVLDNRGRYVSAALIIVRAYLAADSPGCLNPLASFERWSHLVRSALVWLGCDDPIDVMEQSRTDDPGLAELREVMTLWDDAFGSAAVTIKAVVNEATQWRTEPDEHGDIPDYGGKPVLCHPELLDALTRVSGGRGGVDGTKLAYWMRKQARRIVGNKRFVNDGETQGLTRWKLTEIMR
jgi:hypothetical protein